MVAGLCFGTFGVGDGLLSVDGKNYGLSTMGTVVNGCMVAVVVSRLVMETNFWTGYHVLALAASAGMWVLFVVVSSRLSLTSDMSGVATQVFSMPVFYLLVSGRAAHASVVACSVGAHCRNCAGSFSFREKVCSLAFSIQDGQSQAA